MLWINHKATAFSAAWAITGKPLFALGAALFSVMPDAIEFILGPLLARHRGVWHNPLTWLALFAGAWITLALSGFGGFPFQACFPRRIFPEALALTPDLLILAAMFGVAMHLVTDALSISGIPVWRRRRLAGRLYRTGGISEWIVSLAMVAVLLIARWMVWK